MGITGDRWFRSWNTTLQRSRGNTIQGDHRGAAEDRFPARVEHRRSLRTKSQDGLRGKSRCALGLSVAWSCTFQNSQTLQAPQPLLDGRIEDCTGRGRPRQATRRWKVPQKDHRSMLATVEKIGWTSGAQKSRTPAVTRRGGCCRTSSAQHGSRRAGATGEEGRGRNWEQKELKTSKRRGRTYRVDGAPARRQTRNGSGVARSGCARFPTRFRRARLYKIILFKVI